MQKPTTNNNKKLDEKVTQITTTYKQLQKTEFYIVKKTLIGSLRKLCLQGLEILDHEKVTVESIRKKKQIEDMMKRCGEIQAKLDSTQSKNPTIGNGSRTYRMGVNHNNTESNEQLPYQHPNLTEDKQLLIKKSREVARSIIFHQVASQQMKITTSQLDELAKRIQANNQVMKQIQLMVVEQGGDIDKIEKSIQSTYNNVKQANQELQQAAEQQYKNRMLKIRLGMSGFFAAFGLKILGLPGLILGFFSGMMVTR